jgi:carbonic anhydrase
LRNRHKNVELTIERIRQRSSILREMVDDGAIGLAGTMYDVRSGHITFIWADVRHS